MKSVFSLAVACCALTSPALGQSVNIDFGDSTGTPEDVYGAAGLPGAWNAVGTSPEELVDLRGDPTDASITVGFSEVFAMDDPATSGNDEALLDDGILGAGDVIINVTINGLRNARYEVTTYAWTPTMPDDQTFLLYEDLGHVFQITGGPWPGGLQLSITHDVQEILVEDGSIAISFGGGVWGDTGFLNGVQLKRISAADFNDDGIVDSLDLLDVIANWGRCDPTCPGNTNGDSVVDALDYLTVIAEWD
jgi:hypothetical protein